MMENDLTGIAAAITDEMIKVADIKTVKKDGSIVVSGRWRGVDLNVTVIVFFNQGRLMAQFSGDTETHSPVDVLKEFSRGMEGNTLAFDRLISFYKPLTDISENWLERGVDWLICLSKLQGISRTPNKEVAS